MGFGEQIDIRSINKLRVFDRQAAHQLARLGHTRFRRFAIFEHDLELEKLPKPIDHVQVHPRPADKIYGPVLDDPSRHAIGSGDSVPKRFGRRRRRANVRRNLRPGFVRPKIEDQFPRSISEIAKLQAPRLATEERIVLGNPDRTFVGQASNRGRQCVDALDASFDLYVACHGFRARWRWRASRRGTTARAPGPGLASAAARRRRASAPRARP